MSFLRKLFGMGPKVDHRQWIKEGGVVIDVRSAAEFKSGHPTGAVNIPLDRISDVAKKYKKEQKIILCCRSGMRAGNAKAQLKALGFQYLVNVGAWQNV